MDWAGVPLSWLRHVTGVPQRPVCWVLARGAYGKELRSLVMCPWGNFRTTALLSLWFLATMDKLPGSTMPSCHSVLPYHKNGKPADHGLTSWNLIQNQPFPPISWSSQILCHGDRKITDTESLTLAWSLPTWFITCHTKSSYMAVMLWCP